MHHIHTDLELIRTIRGGHINDTVLDFPLVDLYVCQHELIYHLLCLPLIFASLGLSPCDALFDCIFELYNTAHTYAA